MTRISAILSLLALVVSGAVSAGKTPAGPVAGGSTGNGSVAMTESDQVLGVPDEDEDGDRVPVGDVGKVILSAEQLAGAIAALKGFEGATTEGAFIRATTVLADGTSATVALNTETGELTITRNE
jgi:hypothetical protein